MLKRSISLCLLILISFSTFALYQPDIRYSNSGEVIPIANGGSRLYELFDKLFILCGHTRASTSRPWTVSESKNELSKINEALLSESLKKLYIEIQDCLKDSDSPEIFIDIRVNPEFYIHTNEEFDLEEDWNYGYIKRNPFLYMGLNASYNNFAFHSELTVGNPRASNKDNLIKLRDSIFPFNGIGSVSDEYTYPTILGDIKVVDKSYIYGSMAFFNGSSPYENDIPRNAYITYAGENFSFGLYRMQKIWGQSRLGNFIYDEHIAEYDYVMFKSFNKKFTFESAITFPEFYLGSNNETVSYGDKRRVFLTHRLDVQIRDNFKFTFSENVMSLFSNFLDLHFINPATVYHNNLNSTMFNAIAHVELEYVPLDGLILYSQVVVDQGTVPIFEDGHEDQAMGFLLGSEYIFAWKEGLIDFNLELVYTTPALYRRNAPDFIITNSSQISGGYLSIPQFTFIGFKYGGDTLAARFDASYLKSNLSLHFNQTVMLKGEFSIYDKYEAGMFIGKFLTGTPYLISVSNIGLDYDFSILRTTCSAFVDLSLINKSGEFDCQLSLGIKTNILSCKGS